MSTVKTITMVLLEGEKNNAIYAEEKEKIAASLLKLTLCGTIFLLFISRLS